VPSSLYQLKRDGMKKGIESEEIRPVDFSSGVRGKHCAAYRRGHTVKVRQDDGTITVQKFVIVPKLQRGNDKRQQRWAIKPCQ
jgi:hypothetical protein